MNDHLVPIGADNSLNVDFSDLRGASQFITGAGGDIIRTSSGDSYVFSGSGADYVVGGAGLDYLDGGDGVDTISYETAATGMYVDLSADIAYSVDDSNSNRDEHYNFEKVVGSAFADQLVGDDAANTIIGGGGYDNLFGAGGNDRISVESQSYVDGGAGYDTLALKDGGAPVEFGFNTFTGLERVQIYDGVAASFANASEGIGLFVSFSAVGGGVEIATTDFAETIRLGKGADTVDAGDGRDSIFVNDGDAATIDAGGGGDNIFVRADGGGATIDGGSGADTLVVQSGESSFTDATLSGVETIQVRSGASLDLSEMTQAVSRITSGSAASGEGVSIVGSNGADRIHLGKAGDDVAGGGGADVLVGGAGDDTFHYNATGFGRDTVYADLANDQLDLSGIASNLDDLSFKLNNNGTGVIVQVDGLRADTILLKDVTVGQVQAAADDGFFTF